MSVNEFEKIIVQIKPFTDYVYLHVKGEPLMHPHLSEFLDIAFAGGIQVNLTTNGTLLKQNLGMLCTKPALRQLNISLHSIEDNLEALDAYISDVLESVQTLGAKTNAYLVMRLWNLDKVQLLPQNNKRIIEQISRAFSMDILTAIQSEDKLRSITLADRTYLSHDEEFQWPSLENTFYSKFGFCYGMGRMAAILVDGRVVPCCLDGDGIISLGNVFEETFGDIIAGDRALAMTKGFAARKATEELCRHCSYKKRFNRDLK